LIAQGSHPSLLIHGYYEAAKKAQMVINDASIQGDERSFDQLLQMVDCGRGLLSAKIRGILIEAVRRASNDGKLDVERIRIVDKGGGSTEDSKLVPGLIIAKKKPHHSMPDVIVRPRIALISKKIDVKPLEIKMKGEGHFPMSLDISDQGQMAKFKAQERDLKKQLIQKMAAVGATLVISRSLVTEEIAGLFAAEGIFAVGQVDEKELDLVSAATGARIVGDLDDIFEMDLGTADRMEVGKIEAEDTVTISTEKGITILLRGSSPERLKELERIVKSGITVLKHALQDSRLVLGGGAIEMRMATELKGFALSFPGREQLAINSFAEALEEAPQQLARNFGMNPIDAQVRLRSGHQAGHDSLGLTREGCKDLSGSGIMELALIHKLIISRALELASLMLRIDDYIYVKELAMVHKK
jgi:chaperonin GroEL (HSP60 family)